MNLKQLLTEAMNGKRKVIINDIEAEQVKDKLTGDTKGGVTITEVAEDYIVLTVQDVKAEAKTDKLIETVELIYVPFNAIKTFSEGPKSSTQGTLGG